MIETKRKKEGKTLRALLSKPVSLTEKKHHLFAISCNICNI